MEYFKAVFKGLEQIISNGKKCLFLKINHVLNSFTERITKFKNWGFMYFGATSSKSCSIGMIGKIKGRNSSWKLVSIYLDKKGYFVNVKYDYNSNQVIFI